MNRFGFSSLASICIMPSKQSGEGIAISFHLFLDWKARPYGFSGRLPEHRTEAKERPGTIDNMEAKGCERKDERQSQTASATRPGSKVKSDQEIYAQHHNQASQRV